MINSISTATNMIQPNRADKDISVDAKVQVSQSEEKSGVTNVSEMANSSKSNTVSAATETIGSIIDTRV